MRRPIVPRRFASGRYRRWSPSFIQPWISRFKIYNIVTNQASNNVFANPEQYRGEGDLQTLAAEACGYDNFPAELRSQFYALLLEKTGLSDDPAFAHQMDRKSWPELKAKLAELDKKSPKPADDDPQRLTLVAERDKLEGELLPEPPQAMAVQEGGTPGGLFPGVQDVPIHVRGSYTRLGKVIPRRLHSRSIDPGAGFADVAVQ